VHIVSPDMNSPYEPHLYDIVTPETFRDDVAWYRRKARECGGPVLELGAGTGRIALALASDGVSVHALDADPGMLAALRLKVAAQPNEVQSRIVIVDADMRSFQLRERFALIIAPFRVLLHNLTEDDQLACFRRVREHMRPGGHFAFNVFHPALEYMAQHSGPLAGVWRWAGTFEGSDGAWVVRSEANRYDTVRRRVHSQHRYEEYGSDGTLRRTFLHRLELSYLYPSDISRLLETAGFGSVQIWGGFDGRPFERDTDELVVEAGCD
jgi:SAM-dependent methyltransferase